MNTEMFDTFSSLFGDYQRRRNKILDWDIVVNELEYQSFFYIHFWTNAIGKGINSIIPSSFGVKWGYKMIDFELNNPRSLIRH